MGKRGLAAFLSEPRFEGLPATLETPGPNKKGSDRKKPKCSRAAKRRGAKALKRRACVTGLRTTASATSGRRQRAGPRSPAVSLYLTWTPEIAREMTRRWISEVPSKIV